VAVEREANIANLPALYFEDLAVGQSASLIGTVSESDAIPFLDDMDNGEESLQEQFYSTEFYAARLRFGQYVTHGVYTASLINNVISTQLPGVGSVFLSQSFQYLAPVRIGDIITARVEIMELVYARRRVRLFCECLREGAPVLEGEAWIAVLSRSETLT